MNFPFMSGFNTGFYKRKKFADFTKKMHTFSLLFSNKNLILYTLHPVHPFGRKAQIMILVVEPVTLIAMKKKPSVIQLYRTEITFMNQSIDFSTELLFTHLGLFHYNENKLTLIDTTLYLSCL